MPKVTLIDYTGKGREDEATYASRLLVFTKSTRLNMTPENLAAMDDAQIAEQLQYMANTIPSSWEFVDLTFLIEDVTRAACAQQITRTRTASYAMQSQRVADLTGVTVQNPFDETNEPDRHEFFETSASYALDSYNYLCTIGSKKEDARGILPMNTHCNLVAKYNLRNFVDLVIARSSERTQGEYKEIVVAMKAAVLAVWPWAEPFFVPKHQRALDILQGVIDQIGLEVGSGPGWEIAKAMDLLRGER